MKGAVKVKSEPKAFASLSSGLLARKGAAKPAMRPQGFGQGGASLEDLGWDDMGFEPPRAVTPLRDDDHDAFGDEIGEQPLRNPVAGLTPVQSPVHSQQAEIVGRLAPSTEVEDAEEDAEELDETAELFEPEAEAEAAPEAVQAPAFVAAPAVAPAPKREPRPRAAPGSKA